MLVFPQPRAITNVQMHLNSHSEEFHNADAEPSDKANSESWQTVSSHCILLLNLNSLCPLALGAKESPIVMLLVLAYLLLILL